MKGLDILALVLIIIGALNWGLIGFLGFNLVEFLFGVGILATIVYVLVGLGGLYSISFFARKRKA
ncbi:MAG: DUF378 domain-containing protein [Clostridium sp.]|uniref:DUF378 domain-containing protein n=1 Tax=Clostridium sp. TaxID=1506 RepID=UPI003EE45602